MVPKVPTIRELMPNGFLRELIARTKCRQSAYLSNIVLCESVGSKYWPAVEALAQETNPEGFASWKASQDEPVSA